MKNNKHGCDLSSCFLCTQCIKEWLPAIEAQRQTIVVKKGNVIFTEGALVTGIYFVYEGKVKVHKKWGTDKELILRIAGKGEILGHRGMGSNKYYPVSATTLENAKLCFIDLDFFQSTLKVNHELSHQLLLFFADELRESEENMRNLAHMTVKGRLAHALLALRKKFGTTTDNSINIQLSRQDLASLAGTTYETVFRIISELTQDQVLAVKDRGIIVLDDEKLIALTAESL